MIAGIATIVFGAAKEMYDALNRYVSLVIPRMFTLQDDVLVMRLDELYCGLLRTSKNISSFHEMLACNVNLPTEELISLEVFHFDKQFNRMEELFMNEVRKRQKAYSTRRGHDTSRLPYEYDEDSLNVGSLKIKDCKRGTDGMIKALDLNSQDVGSRAYRKYSKEKIDQYFEKVELSAIKIADEVENDPKEKSFDISGF